MGHELVFTATISDELTLRAALSVVAGPILLLQRMSGSTDRTSACDAPCRCRLWADGNFDCSSELNLDGQFSCINFSETFGKFLSFRQRLVKLLRFNVGMKIGVRGQTLHSFFDL